MRCKLGDGPDETVVVGELDDGSDVALVDPAKHLHTGANVAGLSLKADQ